MTEYDFSPDAYQRHMENMHSISRWVDYTEQHRSQFDNAAALTPHHTMSAPHERNTSSRRPPPLQDLPRGMDSYLTTPTRPASPPEEFPYARAPGSPGPMPTYLYQRQLLSPSPSYSHGTLSSWSPLPQPHDSYSQGATFSHKYNAPIPSPPLYQYPVMQPGYVVVSPRKSHRRKKSSSRSNSSRFAPVAVSPSNSFPISDV